MDSKTKSDSAPCPLCNGSGELHAGEDGGCHGCYGAGVVPEGLVRCPDCKGEGHTQWGCCHECHGEGLAFVCGECGEPSQGEAFCEACAYGEERDRLAHERAHAAGRL